jgi:hypothetical protein
MNSKEAIKKIMSVLNLTNQSFYEAKTEEGVSLKMEGEDLEIGKVLYVVTDEGMIPAPAGTFKMEDGAEVEVDEQGMVSKIKMGTLEETKEEETEIKEEEMAESKEVPVEMEEGDIKLSNGDVLRLGGETPEFGVKVKKVGYDGTLSAIADGTYETADGKVMEIAGGAIQGIQSKEAEKERSGGKEIPPVEKMGGEDFSALVELFTASIKKMESKLDEISNKTMILEKSFNKFSKEPAGSPIKKQINPETFTSSTNSKLEGFRRLRENISQKN